MGRNQCTPEACFNYSNDGADNHPASDFAIFGREFIGQYQLYGDAEKKLGNDQFKLPHLIALLAFKGGQAFERLSVGAKAHDILEDLDNISKRVSVNLDRATASMNLTNANGKPSYLMVVTDPDPRLSGFIEEQRKRYSQSLTLHWVGDY